MITSCILFREDDFAPLAVSLVLFNVPTKDKLETELVTGKTWAPPCHQVIRKIMSYLSQEMGDFAVLGYLDVDPKSRRDAGDSDKRNFLLSHESLRRKLLAVKRDRLGAIRLPILSYPDTADSALIPLEQGRLGMQQLAYLWPRDRKSLTNLKLSYQRYLDSADPWVDEDCLLQIGQEPPRFFPNLDFEGLLLSSSEDYQTATVYLGNREVSVFLANLLKEIGIPSYVAKSECSFAPHLIRHIGIRWPDLEPMLEPFKGPESISTFEYPSRQIDEEFERRKNRAKINHSDAFI